MRFDNGQISARQAERSLLLELFASNVFVMTGVLIQGAGSQCFRALFAGGIAVLMLGIFYWSITRKTKLSYANQLANAFPKAGWVLAGIYCLRYSFRAGFLLAIFYHLLQEFLLQETKFTYIVVPILVIAIYGAAKGREKRLRAMELIFWFVFVPFILSMALVVKDVSWSHFMPAESADSSFHYPAVLYVLALYSNVEFILFSEPSVKPRHKSIKNVVKPILLALLCNGLLLALCVGVLGYSTANSIEFPALRVLQSAKVPGGFLERLDILLVAFWTFSVYCALSSYLAYSGELLRQTVLIFRKRDMRWACVVVTVLMYGFSLLCHNTRDVIAQFITLSVYVDIPLGILLVVIVMLKKYVSIHMDFKSGKTKKVWHETNTKKQDKTKQNTTKKFAVKLSVVMLLCVCLLATTGCGQMIDVENWNYVLTLGIDSTNQDELLYSFGTATSEDNAVESEMGMNLAEAMGKYGQSHDQALQIGHLGAVVLSEEIFRDPKRLRSVLSDIEQESQIPLTVSVFGVYGSAVDAMEHCPSKKKTLGEYFNDLIGNNKKEYEKRVAIKNLYESDHYPLYVYGLQSENSQNKIVVFNQVWVEGLQTTAVFENQEKEFGNGLPFVVNHE